MEKIGIKFDLSAISNFMVVEFFTWINYFWLIYALHFGKNIFLLIVVAVCGTFIHELGHALIFSVYGYECWFGLYETGWGGFTSVSNETWAKFDKQTSRPLKCIIYISGYVTEWLFLLLYWQYSGNFVIPALLIINDLWLNRRLPDADFQRLYLVLQEA